MDQEEIYKGWLHKSRVTRGARAHAHALKAIEILIRQQNSGRFDKEAQVTLTLLTNILMEEGIRSPTGGALTPTMVARMFIHLDRTWQGFVVKIAESKAKNEIEIYESFNYVVSKNSDQRRKNNQIRIDRSLEKRRKDALDYDYALSDGNGKRIKVKEYYRRVRRNDKTKAYFIPAKNIEANLRARIKTVESQNLGRDMTDAEVAASIERWKRSALEAQYAALKAEVELVKAKVAVKRTKATK